MPRVRLDIANHNGEADRSGGPQGQLGIRIDTDVFSILSGERPRRDLPMQPVIERWLDCWSG